MQLPSLAADEQFANKAQMDREEVLVANALSVQVEHRVSLLQVAQQSVVVLQANSVIGAPTHRAPTVAFVALQL